MQENPEQNPAHDVADLALSEVQNVNNSSSDTIESKGNQETAKSKVYGEHSLFPFFATVKQISPFILLQLTTLC